MKTNIGQLTSAIYDLLEPINLEERAKVLSSVTLLLGNPNNTSQQKTSPSVVASSPQNFAPIQNNNAKAFFEEKSPKNKGEEFAVAALFRELNHLGDTHTRNDLKEIIKTQAKKSFDDKNFIRDITNAVRQAKFFIKGNAQGEYLLSSTGEAFAQALPDREAAESKRDKKRPSKKKSAPKKRKSN